MSDLYDRIYEVVRLIPSGRATIMAQLLAMLDLHVVQEWLVGQ